ncbi:carbohydrate ABC transporter substrate-binding protein (CUT1 family) [Halanaerobium saccharolyticum]|uniref:Carbohydrate ABC transporter substrate-binding protein (CUT1 family) n=1 Tax=Halanaerobium saccharolyticum TaxID=43595 RepID=A0A4R6M0T8_9FIRM|nr:extracellular solute-binding protein [Halanaerobium saccharolyticum]TDO94733.1 carbohydrate ABC transporter substrate-binding protein (CUT1 family) [Halanaerobium saccharolyticum]
MKSLHPIISILLAVFMVVGLGAVSFAQEVELEFFQNKREAVETFDRLIEKFEKENPEINITQNHVPDAETVLRSRLARNNIPDIMGLGGNFTYGQIADAGIFKNFDNASYLKDIQPAYKEMLQDLHEGNSNYGVPFTANANTVLYNKDKFKELGLDIPKTWDEFITTAKTIQENGGTPFYLTFKDAWTIMVPWNSLAANLQGENFIKQRLANETTFQARYQKVAERIYKLLDYGQDDVFGYGYSQGNQAFANGESFMYIQGVWAINPILEANPDINLGAFALPAVNDADENMLVSGVDTVLTISKNTDHPEAAEKFIKFLLKKENAQFYIDQQMTFSAVENVFQNDPTVVDLKEYFESGKIAPFPDHYYPSGMQVPNLIQGFLHRGNVEEFLEKLDSEWNKVQSR